MCNGKTVTLPPNSAVWIPAALYERIDFELKLPSNVRKKMAQGDMYPTDNNPGYPCSGPTAVPEEWDRWKTVTVDKSNSIHKTRGLMRDSCYVPLYNVENDYSDKSYSELETTEVVPGTGL